MKALGLTILVCLAMASAGCGDDESTGEEAGTAKAIPEKTTPEQAVESPEASTPDASSPANLDTSKKPTVDAPTDSAPTTLVENDLVEGIGPIAEVGDEVTIHYVGASYEGGKEFDASWGDKPFAFRLGSKVLIPGGEEGVKGMKAGGRRELIIPPDLAYGKEGLPPRIGPNETLIFVVDLISVK